MNVRKFHYNENESTDSARRRWLQVLAFGIMPPAVQFATGRVGGEARPVPAFQSMP